jgi:hypothetical protein
MNSSSAGIKRTDASSELALKQAPEHEHSVEGLWPPPDGTAFPECATGSSGRQPALTLLALLLHEISQPITSLLGEIELALRLESGEREMRATFERCLRSLHRVGKLIGDFRPVGEMNEAARSRSPLAGLISQVIERMKPAAEARGCKIKWNAPAEVYIKTNAELLQAALSKILAKIINGCPPGRTIELDLVGAAATRVMRLFLPGPAGASVAYPAGLKSDPEWMLAAEIIRLLGGTIRMRGDGKLDFRTCIEVEF